MKLFVYLSVLLAAGVLYVLSCAPGALWQDSGLIQYRTWHHDIEGPLGLALAHPLFYILAIGAKLTGLGEFGYRVNLVSALAGAVAAANLYLLVRLWLGRHFPAVIAAATLALSHTFWRHASIAETYTLWTALFLGEMVVLLQYARTRRTAYLYALGLLNGLAIAVHMLAVIPLLCYLVWMVVLRAKKAIRWRCVALVALLWMIGALPYEYLIVKRIIETGDVLGTAASAAFGDRWRADVLNVGLSWRITRENLMLMLYNLPTPNLLLFFVGLLALFKVRVASIFRSFVAVLLFLFLAFAFRYTVADRYAFFIPFYSLAAAIVGLGAHFIRQHLRGKTAAVFISGFALLPVAVYAVVPRYAERMHLSLGTRADIPYRNDYIYFLQPWKRGCNGPERFAREALAIAGPRAIIYADSTTVAPLLYLQEVWNERADVKVLTGLVASEGAPAYDGPTFEKLIRYRPVYATSNKAGYAPQFALDAYDFVKVGPLWRITRRFCATADRKDSFFGL